MNNRVKFILSIVVAIFMVQAVCSMRLKSPTWDETNYFGLGYYLLKYRQWDIPASTLHPPLSYYLNSLPYLFYAADESAWDLPPSLKCPECSHFTNPTAGLTLLTDSRYPKDRVLFWSRSTTIFIALILGFFLWKWTHEIYGSLSALCALFLYSFSPTILAHSRLITPDVTLTCFNFISVYYLWKVVKENRWSSIILCAIALGLALLSKYSALLLFPIYLILAAFIFSSKERVYLPAPFPFSSFLMREGNVCKILRLASLLFIIFTLAIFLLQLGYMFHLEYYLKGALHQWTYADKGHPTFLMGMYSSQGWWFYYLIAFTIKTPLPVLIFLFLSLIFYKKNPHRVFLNQVFVLVPVVVYFLFFSIKLLCIGLRYILPIYPFLFMQASMVVGCRFKGGKILRRLIIVVLCCWYLKSSLGIYPHYLAYFNEIVGGADSGYRYLVDSNLDWGQDLKGLGIYMRKKGIDRIHLSYFGAADPHYYGIKYDWMPSYYLPSDYLGEDIKVRRFKIPTSGIVAISATNLQNVYFSDKRFYDWLKRYEPIYKIGYSIFIYDLDQSVK